MPNLMNRAERFQDIIIDLQSKGDQHTNMGTEILRQLWEVYRDSLYVTEEFIYITEDREMVSQRFETFVELCDEAIRPHFDPPDYFDKFKWVVDRVFRYVHIRDQQEEPILIPITNEPVTVEMLLEAKGWISKLIIISNKIELCKTDADIEALFFAGFTGDVADVKQAGEDVQDERIEIILDYTERPLPEGHYNLLFSDIDQNQYRFLLRKMGKTLRRHLD